MKKIQYYPYDAFEFHKKAVSRKKESNEKTMLQSLEKEVEQCYTIYNDKFTTNTLSSLQPMTATPQNKEVLKNLYQFKQKVFKDLFISLTTTESNRRDMLCPNCTLMDCSQLDHYIPKSAFPEFAANPLNLMQCCSVCNQKKVDRWLNGGRPIFLNLYLDNLPQEQYLFVNITMGNRIPKVKFYLNNPAGIETSLFLRIESHYTELELCKRFAERADSVISEIRRDYIAAVKAKIAPSQFWKMVINRAQKDQQIFGFNYWRSILILGISSNSNFCTFIETHKFTL